VKTLLLLDTNYLCYRAYYTTGHLSHEGMGTGVMYGVIQAVESLQDLFDTKRVVFAFDHGCGKRRELFPEYKANRRKKELTEEEQESLKDFRKQINGLRDKYLSAMGYRNVFHQKGYEADDVIASVAEHQRRTSDIVIVSSDKDLWQLLCHGVRCFNPQTKQITTEKSFFVEWGIYPEIWSHVKSIAGDVSDGIPGIVGVGLKTATKWFTGGLGKDTKAYRKIDEGIGIHNRNMKLIRLPFPGVETFKLREDKVTREKREKVLAELGFKVRRVRGVKKRKKESSRVGFFSQRREND